MSDIHHKNIKSCIARWHTKYYRDTPAHPDSVQFSVRVTDTNLMIDMLRQLLDEHERVKEALLQYHSRHEAGLLPCRFTYEKGRKALNVGETHECCPNPEE